MADAGKDHGDTELIGCLNDLGVANRAPGLNDRRGAGRGYGFQAISEWEEGVRGRDRAGEGENGLQGAETRGVDAAHLPGADADGLAVAVGEAGVDDGVRLDVLADRPGEEESAHLLWGGLARGDDAEVGLGDLVAVRVLDQEAA